MLFSSPNNYLQIAKKAPASSKSRSGTQHVRPATHKLDTADTVARKAQVNGEAYERRVINYLNKIPTTINRPTNNKALDKLSRWISQKIDGNFLRVIDESKSDPKHNHVTDILVQGMNGHELKLSLKKSNAGKRRKQIVLRNPRVCNTLFGCIDISSEIKDISSQFIHDTGLINYCDAPHRTDILYNDVCNLIVQKLHSINTTEQVKYLFRYFIDFDNYYLIHQIGEETLDIYDFMKIRNPSKIIRITSKGKTIDITFNNGCSFRLRLHNCRKQIRERLDLKFAVVMTTISKFKIN